MSDGLCICPVCQDVYVPCGDSMCWRCQEQEQIDNDPNPVQNTLFPLDNFDEDYWQPQDNEIPSPREPGVLYGDEPDPDYG